MVVMVVDHVARHGGSQTDRQPRFVDRQIQLWKLIQLCLRKVVEVVTIVEVLMKKSVGYNFFSPTNR